MRSSSPRAAVAALTLFRPVPVLLAVAALGLSMASVHAQPGTPEAAASAPAAPAKPDPSAPKPFDEVVKDAQRVDGFFPVWRKDEKVWLEIPAERIGQPFLLTAAINQSLGERGLYASQMGPDWTVAFRQVGRQMQLVALNMAYRPGADKPSQTAVRQAFAESLLGAAPVASAPHPQRKSVLIDASFLLADLVGYSTQLEAAFRLPYGLARGESFFESARADAGLTTLNARLLFATPRLPAPPLMPTPVPTPPPPETTPDPRSFFVGVTYSLAKLPEQPMAPRLADPRLGFFTQDFTDFSADLKPNQRVHYIDRWRLEKKDPSAALSEPVKPITYWLDKNIPERYRATIAAGILEWNKAFEKIGFKNAIVVQQQSDDADFDTLDADHASIRWFVGSDVGFARGPSKADPRSGQILDADIAMSDVFARGARRVFSEDTTAARALAAAQAVQVRLGGSRAEAEHCDYAHEAVDQMGFALDLLEARGDVAPDSPEAEAFVQAVIKDVIMHEVGHTLGLKHNFKASTTVSRDQLKDKTWTAAHGISGSVMDYNAYNLPLRGEVASSITNTTLGPYDYWAIEYAYTPLAPAQEAEALGRIASRSTEPALAYADDADAEGGPVGGLDPLANRFDLGDDPLAWYSRRMTLSRELWTRVQARGAQRGDDPLRARRVLLSGFRQLRNMPEMVAKYVGGMQTVRDLPGTTGRPAYQPVAPALQRQALQMLARDIFSVDSFSFRPEFLATLAPDYNEWERAKPVSIPSIVLQLQTQALDKLMSAGTAQRLLDLPSYLSAAQRKGALSLDEVYGTLQSTVWSELQSGREIDPMRRNLQRAQLQRVVAILTKGGGKLPADAVSLVRWHAVKLQAQLKVAVARGQLSVETRAHLAESLSGLTEALRAPMSRS
ncbi:zinc-dependent metalloprotease [Ideonella sp. B7]|uniref:zinc-dependent metalloprotease n=1 Tax=Ideonella benzenivorans TaxID=2831643 RepID=UPI001CECFB2E|nr:zinc-dependent metalloprotease [Ideonella benzenivorans]MCA6218883.1 zinc-dependent metalloprotease [Ideonella benzenivorans]